MRLEAKTNKFLLSNTSSYDKKTDNILTHSESSLLKIKKGTILLNWNDDLKMNLDYYARLFGLLLIFAIPMLINSFLIYPGELSLWKGVVGYSTFIGLFSVMVRQRHRCTHISSYQNPFYVGLILNLFVNNYLTYYGVLVDREFFFKK